MAIDVASSFSSRVSKGQISSCRPVHTVTAKTDDHQVATVRHAQDQLQLLLDICAEGAVAVFFSLIVQHKDLILREADRNELLSQAR